MSATQSRTNRTSHTAKAAAVALTLLATACLGSPAEYEEVECAFDQPEQIEVTCGELVVPMDRADPGGPQVRMAVATLRGAGEGSDLPPVLYLPGGPGGGSTSLAENYDRQRGSVPFAEYRDVILVDPRGAGESTPKLDCPEVAEADLAALAEPSEAGLEEFVDATLACRERLTDGGVLLDSFTSADVADDLAALRDALGVDEWDVYGISYGSRLALTLLRDHPDGLRSLILDSPYSPANDLYADFPRGLAGALEAIFQGCLAHRPCATERPDFEGDLAALVERLNDAPMTVTVVAPFSGTTHEVLVTGDRVVEFFAHKLYYDGAQLWHYLRELEAGDASRAAFELALWIDVDLAEGLYLSSYCHEELPFDRMDSVQAAADAEFEWIRPAVIESAERVFAACEVWDVPPADALEDEPVTGEVPVLVLSGSFDPVTPPASGQAVADALEEAQWVTLPGVGHGVVGHHCANDIVESFLADPSAPVDDGCVGR